MVCNTLYDIISSMKNNNKGLKSYLVQNEPKTRYIFLVLQDLMVVVVSLAVFSLFELKYLCGNPSISLLPVDLFLLLSFIYILFIVCRSFLINRKKFVILPRTIYLIIFIVYIIQIILIPAHILPNTSC